MDILTDDFVRAGVRISATGRIIYPGDYAGYGSNFAATARTVRSWVKTGSENGDPPPLFDPIGMVDWWKRNKKQKVPAGILAASLSVQAESPVMELELPKMSEVTSENDDEKRRVTRLSDHDENEETSAFRYLEQARSLADSAYENYLAALNKGRDGRGDAEMYQQEWSKMVEVVRKWEKDIDKIRVARGELLHKTNVQDIVLAVLSALSRAYLASMERLLRRYCPEMDPKQRRAAALDERDRCFEILHMANFDSELIPTSFE